MLSLQETSTNQSKNNMNGDPRLRPHAYWQKESDYEKAEFLEQYHNERAQRIQEQDEDNARNNQTTTNAMEKSIQRCAEDQHPSDNNRDAVNTKQPD